jgi:hypothetical protein
MLVEMTLLKFNVHDLVNAGAFLGPFCFSLFIFLVVFVCLSMFISIINQSFRLVRDNDKSNEQDIFTFMFDQFKCWIGETRQ